MVYFAGWVEMADWGSLESFAPLTPRDLQDPMELVLAEGIQPKAREDLVRCVYCGASFVRAPDLPAWEPALACAASKCQGEDQAYRAAFDQRPHDIQETQTTMGFVEPRKS